MNMIEWIKQRLERSLEQALAHLLEIAILALAGALIGAWPWAENYLAQYAKTLTPIATARILLGACVVTLCSCAYALWHRPRLRVNQLLGGAMLDTKTGTPYCTNCFLTKKILSPLNDADDLELICSVSDCSQHYFKKIKYP